MASDDLLRIDNLVTSAVTPTGEYPIVKGLSYAVRRGGTLAVVGESGSGKSIQARSIVGLLPPNIAVTSGLIQFDGTDLLGLADKEMRRIRGRRIGFIFQDPMSSLNPVLSIGRQVSEGLKAHLKLTHRDAMKRSADLLRSVRLPDPKRLLELYPHQLSGGMRQRVAIAMAISCEPDLLIADEPTTALDVTVQAQVLDLISELAAERNMAVILITHDLGLVARYADDVVVMYSGRDVELGPTAQLLASPNHPYTKALLASRPKIETPRRERLASLAGSPPSVGSQQLGCAFVDRCDEAIAICREANPERVRAEPSGVAACHLLVAASATRGSELTTAEADSGEGSHG